MSEIVSVPPIIDLDALLAPIDGDNSAGESLRYDKTYEVIKEARREDEALAQGDWARDLKVADWPKVIQTATQALSTKSKDLQLAAWLIEGLGKNAKLDRWAGLRDGLRLMRSLLEDFWENVYPEIDPEDDESPLAPRGNVIAAMDARMGDVLKEFPLTAGAQYSYLQYLDSKQFDIPEDISGLGFSEQEQFTTLKAQAEAENRITGEMWRKAKAATSRDFIEARLNLINECWDQMQALDATMDEKFARATPGLGALKKSLDEVRTIVELLAKEKRAAEPRDDEVAEIEGAEAASDGQSMAATSGGVTVSGGAIRNRQEALKRLSEIANFFRQSEPHSPVSYAVQRAVKWGNMPLDEWLADVVKDGTTLENLREVLGFNTNSSNE